MAYLYFAENEGADAAGDSGAFSSEAFLAADVTASGQTTLHFKAIEGDNDADTIVINHAAGKHKEFMQCLADALNYNGPDMYVFFDEDNQIFDKQLIDLEVVVPGTSTCVIANN
jgi:hypothetical protein|tara:strand:- start:146 stop:487 length:342 start_codon:yes stop_codon:yes gene_type:complete